MFLGNTLSGDLLKDVGSINTNEDFNFDDVGIPGFKGKPQEKIPNLVGQVITPLSVDLEALYKHITGYYKTLKKLPLAQYYVNKGGNRNIEKQKSCTWPKQ